MDNWVSFLLVNVVLAIFLGIFTNLASPWVKSYIENRAFTIRERRIYLLLHEYRYIKKFKTDLQWGTYEILRRLAYGLAGLTGLVLGIVSLLTLFVLVTYPENDATAFVGLMFVLMIFGAYTYTVFERLTVDLRNLLFFESYKLQVLRKLQKLKVDEKDYPDVQIDKED